MNLHKTAYTETELRLKLTEFIIPLHSRRGTNNTQEFLELVYNFTSGKKHPDFSRGLQSNTLAINPLSD